MEKIRRLNESLLAKIIGVVLLCALGAGIVYNAVYIHENNWQFIESSDSASYAQNGYQGTYYSTTNCASFMEIEAQRVVEKYESGSSRDELKNMFSAENSNSRFYLKGWNDFTGSYTFIAGNMSDEENYGAEHTFNVIYHGGQYDLYAEIVSFSSDASWLSDDDKRFQVTIAVASPITVQDVYYQPYMAFEGRKDLDSNRIALTIETLSFVLVLIYEFCASGHVKNQEGIYQTWLDQRPWDLVTVIMLAALFFGFTMSASCIECNADGTYVMFSLIPILMIASLWFFFWLMTTAVQIKARTIWKQSLLGKLVHYVKSIPSAWTTFVLTLYIIFVIIGLSGGTDAMYVVILIIADTVILAIGLITMHGIAVIRKAGEELSSGNLDYRISDSDLSRMYGSLRKHGEDLNKVGKGMQIAVQDKVKSERLKAQLITNVSHDIKTPLTSIINYTDLLQKEHTEEQQEEYLEALNRSSHRLKRLTDDLVEASKASTGNIEVHLSDVAIKELLDQSLAEYQEKFEASKLSIITNIKPENMKIRADGRLLWRVLSNLFSNVSKYAQIGSRVYIDAVESADDTTTISVKNISADPLNIPEEELMERFVRGDSSRHSEGSGLGLDIAKSLTELQYGSFSIKIDGDLFKAEVTLKKCNDPS